MKIVNLRWPLLISSIICLLIAESCKTRQAATITTHQTVDNSSKSVHTDESTRQERLIDSSRLVALRDIQVNDSTVATVVLNPVPGSQTVVNKDGSISGSFSSIQTKTTIHHQAHKQSKDTSQKAVSQNILDQAAIHDSSSSVSHLKKDSTNRQVKSDSTVARNFPWWYIALLAGVVGLAFFIVKRFKIL